jgi:glutamate 5-kinase
MRILLKVGSALISKNHRIDRRWLRKKVGEIAALHRHGNEIVIISSGAVAAGMEIQGLVERPKEILELQLLSGEGQIALMRCYRDLFRKNGITVAQVLLTHHNFALGEEQATVRRIMNGYLVRGTIPVVNENDLVNKEELEYKRMFTDNDILAALVAVGLEVDLAILLTDVDGLFRQDPKRDARAELVEVVKEIDDALLDRASRSTNSLGLGGMYSKVKAAQMMARSEIDVLVANGRYSIDDIIENRVRRTHFRSLNLNK